MVLKQTGSELPRRRFPLWVGLALSVATVGPTLAMAGNGQGLVASVGKAVPLVFVIGLVGVSLVGYSFVRLTRHLNHAGRHMPWSGRRSVRGPVSSPDSPCSAPTSVSASARWP